MAISKFPENCYDMRRPLRILTVCVMIWTGNAVVKAQDSIYTAKKIKASQLLNEKNYAAALDTYSDLLYRFPKEPEYLYGKAVCLVQLNRDNEEALTLLKPVNISGYNPMSWYYSGIAADHLYLFDEAIKSWSHFLLLGKSKEIKSLQVNRLVEMAKNGHEYTRTSVNLKVLGVRKYTSAVPEVAAAINGTGKLVKKPVEFCSKTDLRENYRPMMYLPMYTEMNDFVYVAGYESQKKGLRQIYRVKNINHETWGFPELLPAGINTPYDEEYPYFDSRTSTLYFSSKGHSSMGGYDIFKTVYDWNAKTWSAPKNLGFPVNSTYDDYFFVTDEFSNTASFISNRETAPGEAVVYRVKLKEDTLSVTLSTIEEIQKASVLSAEAPVIATAPAAVALTSSAAAASSLTAAPPAPVPASADEATYNRLLSDALNLQLRADSLSRIARDKRVLAKETPDESLKKTLVSDIIRLEKESKKLQREADKKFAVAHDLNMQLTAPSVDTPAIPIDTEAEAPAIVDKPMAAAIEKDEFMMLDKSPYGPANPIPKGLDARNGLIYRIQLGAFSKPRPFEAFGGISPVCFEQPENTTVLKYYAGIFHSLNAVNEAAGIIKKKGFPDAFVVAYLNGKQITTEEAREIEFAALKL